MSTLASQEQPLRVAVIGAGPAGFYAAEHLLKQDDLVIDVDLFDRLPTPFGLVRAGVAPDHQKIKNVTRVFDKVAAHPRFRFFGNVELGLHLSVEDLRRHYHQILYTTGAQTDRSLGIPGEDLRGSHSATEFVAWYNGHPDFRHLRFDLTQEAVAVIGVGNVAVDVARILCHDPEVLAETDIADYALEALRASQVRTVYMLGRRGPAQAAFTNPEIKELGELSTADVILDAADLALDALSEEDLEAAGDRMTRKKLEILQGLCDRTPRACARRLEVRFLTSPVEVVDDGAGGVGGLRVVRNTLYRDARGSLRPRATDETEVLPVGLVFRSVGYHGVPLPGVPFSERDGVIPNRLGRVFDPATDAPVRGAYVGGWIKRGPTGIIGTNKPDAAETVACMLEDARDAQVLQPEAATAEAAERLVRAAQPHYFSYADWQQLDAYETACGEPAGRPRVKLCCVEDMLTALGRTIPVAG